MNYNHKKSGNNVAFYGTMIEEIKVTAKRKEVEGTLEFKLCGNGTIIKRWNEVINQRGTNSSPRVELLRETGRRSKHFFLELPIFVYNSKHDKKILVIDPTEVHNYLHLDKKAVARLTRYFIYPKIPAVSLKRIHINRQALALQYQEMLNEGLFESQAELARYLGVSRVWITKVMNALKTKATVCG